MTPYQHPQPPTPGAAPPIRVLVVDDTEPQRRILVALLEGDPGLQVVGWAANGEQAVRAAAMLKPDVITMDVQMPVLDGIEATRRILREAPTPIVVVSASASRENQRLAFEALKAGALAVLEKPTPGPRFGEMIQELLRTVKDMARVKVIRRWGEERPHPPLATQPPRSAGPSSPPRSPSPSGARLRPLEVVAIGASTGGPQALLEVLSGLPDTFSLPILVVQHIAEGFTTGLVAWLGQNCALPIQIAAAGMSLDKPGIYVAPTGRHLAVRGRSLALSEDPPVSRHRPSATVLFQSVARAYGAAAVGILLTGMGDDGAVGLRDLKQAGAATVAQDERSSVVFGMPAVAIRMGIVDHILPPPAIGPLLVGMERRERGG